MKSTIIAHSISKETGAQIVTFELEYPRFIHSENLVHRLHSRNASSSRAIPVMSMIEQVKKNPAMPIHWGLNQPGMQADVELTGIKRKIARKLWKNLAKIAAVTAEKMHAVGLHKQVANRILEPFQNIKVVVTATCFDNFFWLRCHPDAQPEIKMLADMMYAQICESIPIALETGQWHTPYYGKGYWDQECEESLEDALKISSSCCAQVSYRKSDDSIEKAEFVYDRLVNSKPVHASPFEHQATPMRMSWTLQEAFAMGCTHIDKHGVVWSGNFSNWVQYRQLIPDNVCTVYVPEDSVV